jgi:hypothetical protein
MKFVSIFHALVLLPAMIHAQRTFFDQLMFRPSFRMVRGFFLEMTKHPSSEESYRMNLKMGKLQKQFSRNDSFFCDVNGPGKRSETVPTSVHALRPGDIDIIGALGDSLTAGNGGMATNVFQVTVESKGLNLFDLDRLKILLKLSFKAFHSQSAAKELGANF